MPDEKKPKKGISINIDLNFLDYVPIMQKILFIHNLAVMIKAGLSIVDGLKILSEEVASKKLRMVISDLKIQVEKGKQLSEAMAAYPKIFPLIYVSMIAAGETAGKMEESLTEISDQMKKAHDLTSHVRGALIYPSIVVTAMIGIGIFMATFVLPQILAMFSDMNVALPLPTKILIFVINLFSQYGLYTGISLIILIIMGVWLERKPKIKRVVHAFNLKWPIFGPIIKKVNIARFTMTLSSLLKSAIPIIDAVKITATVESNMKYREDLLEVSESLRKGISLSDGLGRYPSRFPPMVVQMIMVGEQSGEMENMLGELASYYTNEVDTTMKNFSTVIEPVIILILGVGVAGIAVSVILPMYTLAQSF